MGFGLQAQNIESNFSTKDSTSTPDSVQLTFINPDNGFFAFSLGDVTQINDTVSHTVAQGEMVSLVIASFLPTSSLYDSLSPASAAALTHLYIDGIEIPINQNYQSSNVHFDVTFTGTFIRYRLHLLADTAHTIAVRFDSWDNTCLLPFASSVSHFTDHSARINWYGNSEGYSLILTGIDNQGNPCDPSMLHIVNDSVNYDGSIHMMSHTFDGLSPLSDYCVKIFAPCDTVATIVTFTTFGEPVYYTLQNPDGGYFHYTISYEESVNVSDTLIQPVYAGSRPNLEFRSTSPSSPFFGDENNPSASHLFYLSLDSIQLPIDSLEAIFLDNGNTYTNTYTPIRIATPAYTLIGYPADGLIQYRLTPSPDAPHTVLARFDNWEGYCFTPTDLTIDSLSATNAVVCWSSTTSPCLLTLTSTDSLGNTTLLFSDTVLSNNDATILRLGSDSTYHPVVVSAHPLTNLTPLTHYQVTLTLLCDNSVVLLADFTTLPATSDTTQGIANVSMNQEVNVLSNHLTIIAKGALPDEQVCLYSLDGRLLDSRRVSGSDVSFKVPASGVYLVTFSNHAVRRVLIIK